MPKRRQEVFEVVEEIERLQTAEAVMGSVERFAARFGFDFVLLAGLPEEDFESAVLASQWPPEFLDLFAKNDYIKHDPIARIARRSPMPFFWDERTWAGEEDPRAREVMNRAADFGIRQGFVVPIRRNGFGAAVASVDGSRIELPPNRKADLHLVGLYAFDRAYRLKPSAGRGGSSLTPREREVLAWVMHGKTAWEIGQILVISKRTVDHHVQSACHKLGATNRTQAVALALRDGVIEP